MPLTLGPALESRVAGPGPQNVPFHRCSPQRASSPRFSRATLPRLAARGETPDVWAGPAAEAPPRSVPARAHQRVLVRNLVQLDSSCLRLLEHLSNQRRGVWAVLQVSCGAGQEGAKNWLRWRGRALGPEAAVKHGPSEWLKATSTPVTSRSSASICCDSTFLIYKMRSPVRPVEIKVHSIQ